MSTPEQKANRTDKTILDHVQAAAYAAGEKKAENPTIIAVGDLTSYTDYFLIVSASNERQTSAIAKNIETELRIRGVMPQHIEGEQTGAWILQDYGDFLVHVFFEGARDYYDLEGVWQKAPRVDYDEARGEAWMKANPPLPSKNTEDDNAVYVS